MFTVQTPKFFIDQNNWFVLLVNVHVKCDSECTMCWGVGSDGFRGGGGGQGGLPQRKHTENSLDFVLLTLLALGVQDEKKL